MINEISDFSRQCKYFQLEKPSGFEIEKPIQKRLAMNLLKGMAKRTPPGSDRVKDSLKSSRILYALAEYAEKILTEIAK